MNDLPTIITMKWGTMFGPDYVNLLQNACRAAASLPLDFACFTEDPEGLDPVITVKQLSTIPPDPEEPSQCRVWPRPTLFKADLGGLTGFRRQARPFASAGGVLAGRQSQLGSKVPTALERGHIRSERLECQRGQRHCTKQRFNRIGFTGEQKARKVSNDQRKCREAALA